MYITKSLCPTAEVDIVKNTVKEYSFNIKKPPQISHLV